jgi:cephalosporin hydroxylase
MSHFVVRVDVDAGEVVQETATGTVSARLGSREGFRILADLWMHATWESRYVYSFSWLGRPIIQLPDDLLRLQELIYRIKPDVIIETGVAHGGGQVFLAGLCKLIGRGHVVGVDIDIRPPARTALEQHELGPLITLVQGNSVDPAVVARVASCVGPNDKVLVILDSNHSKAHVRAELEAYSPLVCVGSYIVATDGIIQRLSRSPRGKSEWASDNPGSAVKEFLATHPEFHIDEPAPPFDEGTTVVPVTYWPSGYLKRLA